MSYSHTIIVPQDQNFIPSDEQAARGKDFVDNKLKGDYPPANIYKSSAARLFTTEENWRSFTCPRCHKLVEFNHQDEVLSDWWYSSLYGLSKPDQILTVPCCGSQVAGNEFDFGAEAVFSRFALSIEDFNILEDGYFKPEDIKVLEVCLGFKIRIIIAQGT